MEYEYIKIDMGVLSDKEKILDLYKQSLFSLATLKYESMYSTNQQYFMLHLKYMQTLSYKKACETLDLDLTEISSTYIGLTIDYEEISEREKEYSMYFL